MSHPAARIREGIDAVKEQTHAAGLLGQGLLEHQRQLEALLDDVNDPSRAAHADDEQVLAELHEMQTQREKLLEQLTHALGLERSATARVPPFFGAGAQTAPTGDVDRLRHDKEEAARQVDVIKMRVADLETKHDAFKQENWDLYVAHQQLEEQLAARTAAQNKAESERQRLAAELAQVRETYEAQHAELERREEEVRKLQKQHETAQAMSRRERAGFRRNISDLQGQLKRMQVTERPRQPLRSPTMELVAPQLPTTPTTEDSPPLRHRFALDDDAVHSTPPPVPATSEADDLRAKLAAALKRIGRDGQQQRKLREQLAELRRTLAGAGLPAPSDDEDEDDEASVVDDDDAWITESVPVPHVSRPVRVPKRHGHRRIMSRDTHIPIVPEVPENADWIDEEFADESVIVKDVSLDPSMADLLGTHPSMADQAGLRSLTMRSPSGVIHTGALGAELDADAYAFKPELVDVGVMTDGDPAAEAVARASAIGWSAWVRS